MKLRVKSPAADQFVVRSALDNAALVQDENLIGAADGRNAMRDDDRRSLAHHRLQARQDFFFRVRIHR